MQAKENWDATWKQGVTKGKIQFLRFRELKGSYKTGNNWSELDPNTEQAKGSQPFGFCQCYA